MTWAYIGAAAVAAIGGVAAAKNMPGAPAASTPIAAAGSGGQSAAQNVFAQNVPQKAIAAPTPVAPPASDVGTILASATSKAGSEPNKAPTTDAPANAPPSKAGDVLKALPAALADVAPLLALFQPNSGKQLGIIGAQGGPQGQVVPGFNLPGRPTIGELLNSIPRARYAG